MGFTLLAYRIFDTLDHAHLREFVSYPEAGSPQGDVISPLLANVYLHHVLDMCFEQQVKPRLRGRAFVIRYADDFVIGFTEEPDARRVMDVLPKRFERYGLRIHPTKTRLVRFTRPARRDEDSSGKPGSFDLLGFTHYWVRSRKGNRVIKRKTSSKRLSRALRGINEWCRGHGHAPLAEQQNALSQKIRGRCAYYGITGNAGALSRFRHWTVRLWRKWLSRRHRERTMTWERFTHLLQRYPLPPAAVHSTYRPAANP